MDPHSTELQFKQKISGFLGSVVWYCGAKLPLRMQWHVGGLLGTALYLLHPGRKSVVKRNLELCFPEVPEEDRNRSALETFRYAGRGLLSWGFALFSNERRIRKEVEWHGQETLKAYLGTGQPLILLCPHFVTPMLTLRSIGLLSPVVAMYEPPRNPIFRPWIPLRIDRQSDQFQVVEPNLQKARQPQHRYALIQGQYAAFLSCIEVRNAIFLLAGPECQTYGAQHICSIFRHTCSHLHLAVSIRQIQGCAGLSLLFGDEIRRQRLRPVY